MSATTQAPQHKLGTATTVAGIVGGFIGAFVGAVIWWTVRELLGNDFNFVGVPLLAIVVGGLAGTWSWLFAGRRSVVLMVGALVAAVFGTTGFLRLADLGAPPIGLLLRPWVLGRIIFAPEYLVRMMISALIAMIVAAIITLPAWERSRPVS